MGPCQAPSHTNTRILTLALTSPKEQKECEQDSLPQHPHRTKQAKGPLSSPGARTSIGFQLTVSRTQHNCLPACPATISSTQGCSLLLYSDKATEKASVPPLGFPQAKLPPAGGCSECTVTHKTSCKTSAIGPPQPRAESSMTLALWRKTNSHYSKLPQTNTHSRNNCLKELRGRVD